MSSFLHKEILLAAGVTTIAHLLWLILLLSSSPPNLPADITDDNAKPTAVAITPVPLLKLGGDRRPSLPLAWERRAPDRVRAQPLPSPRAETDAQAIPSASPPDSGLLPFDLVDDPLGLTAPSGSLASPRPAAPGPAGPEASGGVEVPGSPEGSEQGTESDPLKARAIGMYRAQLASWFLSRFSIRGKIPFESLRTLRAVASVSVTPTRTVAGFALATASGNPVFDETVRATLAGIRASGDELPAPPPLYADVLGQTLSVSFQCTVRSQCE